MRMRKWVSAGLASVLLAGLLAACGSAPSGSGGTAPKADSGGAGNAAPEAKKPEPAPGGQTIELRYPWWGNVARHEKYNKLMDMFEQQNPGVKVIREPGSWDDYWKKLPTQTAGGTPPDILQFTTVGQMPEYADKGAMLPLDDYFSNGTIDVSNFNKNILELGKYKGKTYMITKGLAAQSFMVNVGLLKQKGIDVPKTEYATWDEFTAYLREMKAKLGKNEQGKDIYPLMDDATDDIFLESWLRLKGKNLFSEDGKSFGFTKADLIEWFNLWQGLKQEGLVPPAEVTAEEGKLDWEQGMIAKHRIVMDARPGNHLKVMQKAMKDELTLVRLPGGNGKYGELLTGAFLGISAKSKHPDMVAKLINMWMNDLAFNQLYENEHGIVQNEKILKEMNMDPGDRITAQNMQEVVKTTTPQASRLPGMAGIFDQIKKSYDEINFGKTSVEKAVDTIFAEAERIMKK